MKSPVEIIQAALREGRKSLFEHEARALVRSAGIIVPRFEIADAGDERAIQAAGERLKFPVALKAVSAGILHKTDAGAVVLDIKSARELASAVRRIRDTVRHRAPEAVIQWFLIEKMMPAGLELLVGGLRDEQFGPSVAFGLGGVWVEALKDVAFGVLPMTRQEMLAMMAETRAGALLKGFRGGPATDEDAVFSTIDAVSQLLNDHPEIRELELNPLRVYTGSAAALDVRVLLSQTQDPAG